MRFAHLFVSVAFGVRAVACETAPPPTSTPEEGGSVVGTKGMVSTAHPIATEAGLSILRKGGNAFDAAVAIASTLNVVEPMMSGMGGYGTILVYGAGEGRSHYLDASGKIPLGVDSDVYRAPTPDYMENRRNAKAVSTPGAANAWAAMSERFGTLPWAELLEPAIAAAEEGFVLDQRAARFIERAFPEWWEPISITYRGLRVRNRGNAHGFTIEYGEDGKPVRFTGGTDPRGTGLARGY